MLSQTYYLSRIARCFLTYLELPVFYEDEIGLTGTVWTRDRK